MNGCVHKRVRNFETSCMCTGVLMRVLYRPQLGTCVSNVSDHLRKGIHITTEIFICQIAVVSFFIQGSIVLCLPRTSRCPTQPVKVAKKFVCLASHGRRTAALSVRKSPRNCYVLNPKDVALPHSACEGRQKINVSCLRWKLFS